MTKKKSTKKTAPRAKRTPKKIPKNRRWGLEKLTFNKAAQEYIDQDYIKSLEEKDKDWLSKFNEEYYGNTFKKGRGPRNLHVKDDRKLVYDQTNARNRDIYNNRYKYIDSEYMAGMDGYETSNPEDARIELMDKQRRIKSFMDKARLSGLSEEEVSTLTASIFDIEI